MVDLNYEQDLSTDKDALEECLVEQAELYGKWSKAHAQSIKERDDAKDLLNVVKADLDMKVRKNWDILGFDKKPTDMAITSWILAHKDYRASNFHFIEANYNMNVLEGAKWAFQHRKDSLDNLVKLYLNNYYADSRAVDQDAREMLSDMRQKKHMEIVEDNPRTKLLRRRSKNEL